MPLPQPNSPKSSTIRPVKVVPAIVALAAVAAFGFGSLVPAEPVRADANAGQTVQTPFGQAPMSFADLVDRVKPSVVSVSVVNDGGASKVAENSKGGDNKKGPNFALPDLPPDHPLHDFFKNLPKDFGQDNGGRPKIVQGQGSGFVISPDGYVVTNNHVIDGATKIQVQFDGDETKYDAKLIGTDPRTDVALLKIESKKTFPAVKLSSKDPRVGDWALAVGNPFGLGGTVTAGIVSALARDIGSGPYDYLQIDAAVNRGNSGGPTFNLEGEVIGVNTAIFSPSGGNVGIAFAVPARTVNEVVNQLRNGGTVKRGWLGVKIQNVDEDTAASIGMTTAHGALVSEVTPNGPAAAAGIKTQDAILQVNDSKISDSRDLARKIAELAPDSPVNIKVWRNNSETSLKVKLGLFPKNAEAAMSGVPDQDDNSAQENKSKLELSQLGLTLMPARSGSGSDEGVAIAEVDPSSAAAEKGIKAGDVILEVSGQAVNSPEDVASGIKKAEDMKRTAVLLHIKSSDQKRFVAVQLASKKG
ncbi:serine protease [Hyphomicrobium methylovorum]|uniref:Do family serine endopeptidase n=1 Tax=Hyphomicrobium methylovorum TaxID=84 RepID=UPI0015E72607|nr:Do family serine endopeptidase [Hyphomicrobium methylovorum]MBA2124674.1 serine protease [Hyphomicrobium methylovorum]